MRTTGRLIALGAAAALAAGSGVAAHAADASTSARAKVRTVTIKYTGGCGFNLNAEVLTSSGAPSSCALGQNYALARKAGEKYLTIVVADQTASAVSGSLWLKGGTGTAVDKPFCGSLKNYLMGQSTYSMDLNASADATCPGAATTGTVVIKYSNVPIR